MKHMIFTASVIGFLLGCSKESANQNYLPGKWNMVQTALYEDGSLKAISEVTELNCIYNFSSCETGQTAVCDMYIEEDGNQEYYQYVFDSMNKTLILGDSSTFQIQKISSSELVLQRSYSNYRSVYSFVKSEQ